MNERGGSGLDQIDVIDLPLGKSQCVSWYLLLKGFMSGKTTISNIQPQYGIVISCYVFLSVHRKSLP